MLIVVGAVVAGALITAAVRGGGRSSNGAINDVLSMPTITSGTEGGDRPVTPTGRSPATLLGFAYPIAGACLPADDRLLPGAPREYRRGVHEGVDFYGSYNCTAIGLDTEVLAAQGGTVVRADWAYQDLTGETLAELMERVEREGSSSPDATDIFRGRQVWIDHGEGIVTRYAHLNRIAQGVVVGAEVAQADLIAYVGESGTPASVTEPGTEVHLHFEVRVGDRYLGQELGPAQARSLYEEAWALSP